MVKTSESLLQTHQLSLQELKDLLAVKGQLIDLDLMVNEAQQVVGLQYVVKVDEAKK